MIDPQEALTRLRNFVSSPVDVELIMTKREATTIYSYLRELETLAGAVSLGDGGFTEIRKKFDA